MRRLFDSCKIYRMEPQLDLPAITDAVLETIRANNHKACYIRPIIYRGYNALGVNPFPCPVDAAILTWEWGAYLGQDALENGVDVRISSWARPAANTFPTLAKTSANYANSQLIKMEAVTEGYSEGIALDTAGYLSEGSGQNLFIVRDNVIYTPPLTASILPGITRDSVHHAGGRSRVPRTGRNAAARDAVHLRRSLLCRHGRRDHPDPHGRQDCRRQRPAGPDHRSPSDAHSSTSSTARRRTGTAG